MCLEIGEQRRVGHERRLHAVAQRGPLVAHELRRARVHGGAPALGEGLVDRGARERVRELDDVVAQVDELGGDRLVDRVQRMLQLGDAGDGVERRPHAEHGRGLDQRDGLGAEAVEPGADELGVGARRGQRALLALPAAVVGQLAEHGVDMQRVAVGVRAQPRRGLAGHLDAQRPAQFVHVRRLERREREHLGELSPAFGQRPGGPADGEDDQRVGAAEPARREQQRA